MKVMCRVWMLAVLAISLQSCSLMKALKLAKQGEVKQTDYLAEIPITFYHDLPFIEVRIQDKTYSFLFDTGAEMSVIGEQIIADVPHKAITSLKAKGSTKDKQDAQLISVENIGIAGIDFEHTSAIVADLSHLEQLLGCIAMDGIIGNNLMRKANWQLDYENSLLKLTDGSDKLIVSDQASEIVMNAKKIRNILLEVTIDGVKKDFTFDTGSSGKFSTDTKFFESLKKSNAELVYYTESGDIGADLLGLKQGTDIIALGKSIDIGGLKFKEQEISMRPGASSLIGNQVWKNYTLTIDWAKDILFLENKKTIEPDSLEGLELTLSPNYVKNKIVVSYQRDDRLIEPTVHIGAEVMQISGEDVSQFSNEELCAYWEREKSHIRNAQALDIVILEEGLERNIRLTKQR